jgi:hypothetical protein
MGPGRYLKNKTNRSGGKYNWNRSGANVHRDMQIYVTKNYLLLRATRKDGTSTRFPVSLRMECPDALIKWDTCWMFPISLRFLNRELQKLSRGLEPARFPLTRYSKCSRPLGMFARLSPGKPAVPSWQHDKAEQRHEKINDDGCSGSIYTCPSNCTHNRRYPCDNHDLYVILEQ